MKSTFNNKVNSSKLWFEACPSMSNETSFMKRLTHLFDFWVNEGTSVSLSFRPVMIKLTLITFLYFSSKLLSLPINVKVYISNILKVLGSLMFEYKNKSIIFTIIKRIPWFSCWLGPIFYTNYKHILYNTTFITL